ncbi:MAG: TetR family transcriptional regulator [Candidatus Kapaibacterium sp.]
MATNTTKAEETQRNILNTAMQLFLKEGYEKATMREIARKAGLSPGAAYYYFPSKEHIIQYYYEEGYEEQLEASRKVLEQEKSLEKRLAGVVRAHMEVAQPYHPISRILFKTAADPTHPISPFSSESKELRDLNIQMFVDLLEGSTTSLTGVPKKFLSRLPELLWLYKMGVILYWVHDSSPNQEKTFSLIDTSAALIAKIITASKLPGIKTLVNKGVEMFDNYKPYE